MDIKSLRYFVEIARCKSFTTAAQRLFVTQPTLSRQIADLEDELGQTLFDRSTRRIELTEKGIFLLHRAQSILELVESTKREAISTSELSGELTIAAGETPALSLVAEALQDFQNRHPNVTVRLLSANAQDAASQLRMGTADFAVFNMPADVDGFSYITLPQQNRWGLLTRRDGPFAGKTDATSKDFDELALYTARQERMREPLAGWLGRPFDTVRVIGTYTLLYNASLLVRAGAHALCIDGIVRPDDEIAFLPLSPALKTDVVLAWPSAAPARTLTDTFLKTLRKRLDATQKTDEFTISDL